MTVLLFVLACAFFEPPPPQAPPPNEEGGTEDSATQDTGDPKDTGDTDTGDTDTGDTDTGETDTGSALSEDCSDGTDNDSDGLVDCEDGDCWEDPSCGEVLCEDGIDNGKDGFSDCDDEDCLIGFACYDFLVNVSAMNQTRTSRKVGTFEKVRRWHKADAGIPAHGGRDYWRSDFYKAVETEYLTSSLVSGSGSITRIGPGGTSTTCDFELGSGTNYRVMTYNGKGGWGYDASFSMYYWTGSSWGSSTIASTVRTGAELTASSDCPFTAPTHMYRTPLWSYFLNKTPASGHTRTVEWLYDNDLSSPTTSSYTWSHSGITIKTREELKDATTDNKMRVTTGWSNVDHSFSFTGDRLQ